MGNRVQPGGRVDEEIYERFREWVRSQHGAVRGNLGAELEKAMSERMNTANGPDRLTRIENDVATIKATLADSEGDGGTTAPTPEIDESTHARSMDKPAANQPRSQKVDYLMSLILDDPAMNQDRGSISTTQLRQTIKEEYDFGESTVDEYVEGILSRLDAIEHPKYPAEHIWGDRIQEVREELRNEASEELDDIS